MWNRPMADLACHVLGAAGAVLPHHRATHRRGRRGACGRSTPLVRRGVFRFNPPRGGALFRCRRFTSPLALVCRRPLVRPRSSEVLMDAPAEPAPSCSISVTPRLATTTTTAPGSGSAGTATARSDDGFWIWFGWHSDGAEQRRHASDDGARATLQRVATTAPSRRGSAPCAHTHTHTHAGLQRLCGSIAHSEHRRLGGGGCLLKVLVGIPENSAPGTNRFSFEVTPVTNKRTTNAREKGTRRHPSISAMPPHTCMYMLRLAPQTKPKHTKKQCTRMAGCEPATANNSQILVQHATGGRLPSSWFALAK